jgi:L,D-transpeptidase-like protein
VSRLAASFYSTRPSLHAFVMKQLGCLCVGLAVGALDWVAIMLNGLMYRFLAAFAVMFMTSSVALANLVANIDLSRQLMTVSVDGTPYAQWRVSTGRNGYGTPTGSFRPYLLRRMHYSSKYENSPMPHSVFFRGGFAIHGTQYVKRLGIRASHGCVRLHPRNAAKLYHLVLVNGLDNTRIRIHW